MAQIERRLAAIMLADLAGYSAMMERDESRTFRRVLQLREEIVLPSMARHGGRIIKTTGDGFLAEFSSGTAALLCGIDIQRRNTARENQAGEADRLQLRIGINLGDIIIDGDDVSGDGVNVAARLEPFAPKDGICVSAAVRDQVRDELDVVFEDMGEQQVKNITRPIRAYRIDLANHGVPPPSPREPAGRARWYAIAALVLAAPLAVWMLGQRSVPAPVAVPAPQLTQAPGSFAGIRITSALVVGNDRYAHHSLLQTAANDASAIATVLRLQGVPVTVKLNVGVKEMRAAIAAMRQSDSKDSILFFYFAGHGDNVKGTNLIMPSDAIGHKQIEKGDGADSTIAANAIYAGLKGKVVVLLDTHGEPVTVPDNVVLAISGSRDHEAMDSYTLPDGSLSTSSPYTASLIEMLASRDENLPTAFMKLNQRVGQKSKGSQIPWVSASLVSAGDWGTGSAAP